MKKVHLLCNAHLDPAWLWRWNEGLAEAISTFRVAAEFCENYDCFIFNHNEALLYEWVEEYEPQLFERIRKLVKMGKWHIMGGWYLQPDCVMPSGESFLSQIDLGLTYFQEKFGVKPLTSINFDPFGHTRGLVQIMKKSGFDNYIFMRPGEFCGNFIWEGFDGSKLYAHGMKGGYNTLKGKALEKVKEFVGETKSNTSLCLWGIGNHGGGPSKIDLDNINEFIKESDCEILHSYCENYFKDIDKNNLKVVNESLIPSNVGCYTSMCRIKQANRRVENKLAVTEKIMSYADMQTDMVYNGGELNDAKKALAFCQFHDILPGSAIKAVEDDSLRTLSYAEEIADRIYNRAFFKLCEGQKAAEQGSIPILVFNPHPYEIEGEFECGFMLDNQNWNENEVTLATVYDEQGNVVVSQNEKPECTFNLDWIQKVSFFAKIAPASISRFNCKLTTYKTKDLPHNKSYGDLIDVKNDRMYFSIDRKTGLISEYIIDGKTVVKNSGILEVYRDNEDPWGMTVKGFNDIIGAFGLMSDAAANEFIGYPEEKMPNVRVVEDGEVRIKVQSFWEYKSTKALVEYTIPKKGIYVDVNIILFSNEPNVMIKYRVDTAFSGKAIGQTAFGREELYQNGDECVYQKWCGIKGETSNLCILNKGTYGGSFTGSSIKLSLLRTPVYAAHPINDRPIAPHTRFLDHIDMGERRFSFRLTNFDDYERKAQVYNEEPQLISFFPSGNGEKKSSAIVIDNPAILLSSIRKKADKYILTLYNSSDKNQNVKIIISNLEKEIIESLGKYEFKIIEL